MKQNKSGVSISVFFPCYNDEKTIGGLVVNAFETLENLCNDYEVIVVNDGSVDKSMDVLNSLKKKYKSRLLIINHKINQGYGGALKSGFLNANKELVFYTDGDGQYDVSELAILLSLMTDDIDVVNGIKMQRQDYAHRVIIGSLYAFIVRWMFLLPTYDVDCDFRLIRRKNLDKIKNKLTSSSGSICVELIKRLQLNGAKFRQVSVHHLSRKYGKSQFFRADRLFKTFCELSALWFRLMI